MRCWPTFLVWCLATAKDVVHTFLKPDTSQDRQFTSALKKLSSAHALLHVRAVAAVAEEETNPDDYVFAACVWLRELRLAWPERPANVSTDSKMTVEMCAKRCKAHRSIHFALGGGNSCSCFDRFDAAPHGDDPAKCDSPCAGDPGSTCGGPGAPQSLQVYTYAHHAIEPEKDAIWLCGHVKLSKGTANVTGEGMMRSLLCADGYVPSEPGGAQLLCDADKRKWVPEGKCISLAEALESARGKHSAALEAAKTAQEKADQAEIDAADAVEDVRKAKQAHRDARAEAARLARVASKELTSAAPKVKAAKTSSELAAYTEGAGARARAAADGLRAAKAAAEKAEAAVKAIPEKKKAAQEAAKAAQHAIAEEKKMADLVAEREAAIK